MAAIAGRCFALALGLVAFALLTAAPVLAEPPKVGDVAPDFHGSAFGDQDVALSDYKGQVLIINFWATWCGPCKKELPLLDGYYQAAQKYGLRVLAVTTEDSAPLRALKPLADLVSFQMVRHFHGPYRILGAVPTNYVIDRKGVVRYAQAGAFTLDSLNAVIVPLLKEPAPGDAPPAPQGDPPKPN